MKLFGLFKDLQNGLKNSFLTENTEYHRSAPLIFCAFCEQNKRSLLLEKSPNKFYVINANIAIIKHVFVFQPSGGFDFDSNDSMPNQINS